MNNIQKQIYDVLTSDVNVMSVVGNIYLSIQQDVKCPFLLVSIVLVRNFSIFTMRGSEIEFELILFTKEKTHNKYTNLLIYLDDILSDNLKVVSVRRQAIKFEVASDLVTKKIIANYKMLVKHYE